MRQKGRYSDCPVQDIWVCYWLEGTTSQRSCTMYFPPFLYNQNTSSVLTGAVPYQTLAMSDPLTIITTIRVTPPGQVLLSKYHDKERDRNFESISSVTQWGGDETGQPTQVTGYKSSCSTDWDSLKVKNILFLSFSVKWFCIIWHRSQSKGIRLRSQQSQWSQVEQPKRIVGDEDISLPWKEWVRGPEVAVLFMAFDYLPLIQGIHSGSVNRTSACNSHGSSVAISALDSYVFPKQNSARDRRVFALYPLHGHLHILYM